MTNYNTTMTDTSADPTRQLLEDFEYWTARINAQSYKIIPWLERSKFFREHSFYRLAIADAYKAFTLSRLPQQLGKGQQKLPKDKYNEIKHQAAEALVTCLYDIGASEDAIQFEEHCSTNFKESTTSNNMKKEAQGMTAASPRIWRERYPWVPERDNSALATAQAWFMDHGGFEINESTLSGGDQNNKGVFTNRKIEKGQLIFKEVCLGAVHYEHVHEEISRLAKIPSLVPQPDGWPTDRLYALEPGECLKYLTKKRGDFHPLKGDTKFSTFVTNYKLAPKPFNFQRDIVRIVDLMDLRPEFHPNHDIWVILELIWRIENTGIVDVDQIVCPKYASLINHSCAPNVVSAMDPDFTPSMMKVVVVAMRDIEVGEELFLGYIRDCEMDVAERRKRLQYWLGEGVLCQCLKCRADVGEVVEV
jgi:hypothetical protein